jgi:hypothetical protein
MSNQNPSKVRHLPLDRKTVADSLSALDNVCSTAATCPEVQGSPVAKPALDALQQAVKTAHSSLSARQSLAQALLAAIKTLNLDFATVQGALRTYEAAVASIAGGNASVINKAGLLSRDLSTPPAALGAVSTVRSRPGKNPMAAILTWPRAPGATSYAIELNPTPENLAGPWIALSSGSSRRRVVKGPAPASQLLARVAALAGDGTASAWSDPILVTTL